MREIKKYIPRQIKKVIVRAFPHLRKQIPPINPHLALLHMLPKYSVGVEIGVHMGQYASAILAIVRPTRLHLIDPWELHTIAIYDKSIYGKVLGASQSQMNDRFIAVQTKFRDQVNTGQIVLHRDYAENVVSEFADGYFDWVYIDGNHLYEYVAQDLILFYPKIKQGGFMAGDDYNYVGWWEDGVTRAVDEFTAHHNLDLTVRETQFIFQKID